MSETPEQPASVHGQARYSLTVGVVAGVTPDRWVRVWRERMPEVPLLLRPVDEAGAFDSLDNGVDFVFARTERTADDDYSVIRLWEETPVVVAPKDSPFSVVDTVTLAELVDENTLEGADDAVLDLVAAGVGVARMPQSVFRATGRRDVVARPITDAEPTRIALVWRTTTSDEVVDEFIGVVRGRTAKSSRGAAATQPVTPAAAPAERRPTKAASSTSRARGARGGKGGNGGNSSGRSGRGRRH